MSYHPNSNSDISSVLDLRNSQIDTQVQKFCEQGDDFAIKGEHEQAVKCYSQAIALNHNFELVYCARGKSAIELKDYHQAEADYKTALRINPALAIAHGGLAQIYYKQQKYPAALLACDRAIEKDRDNLDFYRCRAATNRRLKDYPRILADCKFILEQQPNDLPARWLNARSHFHMENHKLAIFNFSQYLNLQNNDVYAYYYRGVCYERLGNRTDALADLNRAIELEVNLAILYRRRGRIRQHLGDFTGAMSDYDRTISIDPKMAQAYTNRADIYINRGDYARAMVQCNEAIHLNPKLISAHYQRALIHTEVGNLHAALADYHRLIQLQPLDIQAYIQRSWIYFRHGEYTAAMTDCEKVLSIDRNSVPANYLLGVVQSLSGLKQEAIFSFTKVMDSHPSFICALYHRGLLEYDLKHEGKAMKDFELAQEIQGKGLESASERDETGFYAEGLALYYMGQTQTAISILQQAALLSQKLKSLVFHQQIIFTIEALSLN
jgi:tetratricopeptide (TPR) repeat protein